MMSEPNLQPTRRRILADAAAGGGLALVSSALVSSGLLSVTIRPAAATPESMRAAIRNVIGEATVRKGRIKLDIPPLVESGNAVSLAISVESPMTANDHVKAIHVFNEKNPQSNVIGGKAWSARRPRVVRYAHSPGRQPDRHRHCRAQRRLVLERTACR